MKAKLRNLHNNAIFEKTFTSDESVEEATYDKRKARYSWTDGDNLVFMDSETFEEIRLPKDTAVSEDEPLPQFKEGEEVKLLQCEGKYIGIDILTEK